MDVNIGTYVLAGHIARSYVFVLPIIMQLKKVVGLLYLVFHSPEINSNMPM